MSVIPVPKFEIGQAVYEGSTHESSEALPCPDCHDTRQWTVTTKAGESFAVSCQRCAGGYRSADTPSLSRRTFLPAVKELTIGRVTIQAGPLNWADDEPVNYMCSETGVGSGRVYKESQLHATAEEAQSFAEGEARRLKAEWDAKPDAAYRKEIGALAFRDAFGADQAQTIWSVSYHARKLREKVEEWLEDDNGFEPSSSQDEAIRDALRDLEWHDSPSQNPLIKLVRAARVIEGAPELAEALKAFAFIAEPKREQVGAL